jgi:hypothetical protein
MPYRIINDKIVYQKYDHCVRFEPQDVNESFRNNGVFRIYRDREKSLPSAKEHYFLFIWHEDIGRDKDLRTCISGGAFPLDILRNANKYNIPYCFY